jgi:DNA polymerase-4
MTPLIMHVDMDAFFAAVEELADPSLRGKALVVAGPGDRSIVTTASYRARSCGINTGMTVGQARCLCKNLIVLKADYRKYAHASRVVMNALESFTPLVKALSVDEAFMEISDLAAGLGAPEELGRKVKEEVRRASGLTCSVGIAHGLTGSAKSWNICR